MDPTIPRPRPDALAEARRDRLIATAAAAALAAGLATLLLAAPAGAQPAPTPRPHPAGIGALGPRMLPLPPADGCVARVEVWNIRGAYTATETLQTDRGPVSIAYRTVGGHNADDHDSIEVVALPAGLHARPQAAAIRDGATLVVCLFEYVGG